MFLCRLLGRREPARMDWKRYAFAFLAFNAAGGVVWGVVVVLVGYLAGESYAKAARTLGGGAAAAVAVVVLIGVAVWRVRKHRRQSVGASAPRG